MRPVLRRSTALLALLAACGPGVLEPDEADPRLQTSVVPDGAWGRVERDAFSYAVPPGFEKLDVQPIDSDAAIHQAEGSNLMHDYGWYTGPWSHQESTGGDPVRDVVRQRIRIGGRPAELVSFRHGDLWVLRAWWGDLESGSGPEVSLLLRGETDDPVVRDQLLGAIYSVEFGG